MQKLNENFLIELFKICLRNKKILEIAIPHIKYSFLPNEEYKEIWSAIIKYHNATNKLVTLGILSQEYSSDLKVLKVISEIKDCQIPDKENILNQLEEFVKSSLFYEAYEQLLPDLFNAGKKDEAYTLMRNVSDNIGNFSIREQYFTQLYGRFIDRYNDKQLKKELGQDIQKKIPTGIDEWDRITRGGVDKGDTLLALAQSGVGKSKFLRHVGLHASRRGFKGLHVSAEGTLEENLDMYDAGFAGQKLWDIERANLRPDILEKVKKGIKDIRLKGGEVFIEAFEQFNTATLADVRNLIIEIEKVHGKIDFLCLDYLELFDPGDGKKYSTSNDGERKRREALANKLKNIAIEFNIAIFTATQSSTVTPELLNDPEFVQTRYNISEFKGVIRAFSYFITFNQTKDELDKKMMRIYNDKIRKYASGQIVHIYQRYDRERFYDREKTLKELFIQNE